MLEFLASPEGSKGLAAPTFEHPLKETNQNQIVKNFGEFIPDKVTNDELGENNSLALKMMKEAGIKGQSNGTSKSGYKLHYAVKIEHTHRQLIQKYSCKKVVGRYATEGSIEPQLRPVTHDQRATSA